jgi:hypothetical protein
MVKSHSQRWVEQEKVYQKKEKEREALFKRLVLAIEAQTPERQLDYLLKNMPRLMKVMKDIVDAQKKKSR